MKSKLLFAILTSLIFAFSFSYIENANAWPTPKGLKEKFKKKVQKKIDKKIDKKMDKSIDKGLEGPDLPKGEKKSSKKEQRREAKKPKYTEEEEKGRKERLERDGPLVFAIMDNELEGVKKAIKDGHDVNSVSEQKYGSLTPLHYAAAYAGRHPKIIQVLVDNGALVNKTDNYGKVPLYYCAQYLRRECAEILLKNGTDVSGERGRRIIHIVEYSYKNVNETMQEAMINLLKEYGAGK